MKSSQNLNNKILYEWAMGMHHSYTNSYRLNNECKCVYACETDRDEEQTWFIKAADRDTSSISLPSNTSSSLTLSDRTTVTPSSISTFLTWRNQASLKPKSLVQIKEYLLRTTNPYMLWKTLLIHRDNHINVGKFLLVTRFHQ